VKPNAAADPVEPSAHSPLVVAGRDTAPRSAGCRAPRPF